MPRISYIFKGDDPLLRTVVGVKEAGLIRIFPGKGGAVLFGPYVDLPAGTYEAILTFDPGVACEGAASVDICVDHAALTLAERSISGADVRSNNMSVSLRFASEDELRFTEIRVFADPDFDAGIASVEIRGELLSPSASQGGSSGRALEPDRPVGTESRKSYRAKLASGFFDRYLSGAAILEVGYKGFGSGAVPIVPQATGIDLDYPGYDGIHLPFADGSQDAVYSSHCLEHITDDEEALREWYRVLKVGGYLVVVVPHQYLYEKRLHYPSTGGYEHKRYYTPATLLQTLERLFEPNTYRVRHLADNDAGYDYDRLPGDTIIGCFEIELVVQKLRSPPWKLDDGTCRAYAASEFFTDLERQGPLPIETDFSVTDRCIIWGPYLPLRAGDYQVRFFFEATGIGDGPLRSAFEFDVARHTRRVAAVRMEDAQGGDMIRSGSVVLDFANAAEGAVFEFRVFTQGQPFPGRFRFFGATLRPREASGA